MSQINQSPIWQALNQHKKDIESISLREMFKSDPERFNQFHIQFNDLLLDYIFLMPVKGRHRLR